MVISMSADIDQSTLYLIGFRIEPDIYNPQLYTIYVDGDRPIMCQGQPIVFFRPDLATAALHKSDCGAAEIGPAPTELQAVFDIAAAIYTLNEEDEAEDAELLDCINILLDFANCVDELMPKEYRRSLEMLADHLTFNKRFAEFLESNNLERQKITDAIYWTLGMIVYQMKIVVA
jgi:hypothetical protein